MSSSSTNLNLTLPAGGERLSLNILNENWGKLDDFAGEHLNKVQTGVASKAALASLLDSLLASMPANGVKSFQFGFTTVEAPFTQTTYFGTLYKSGTDTTYAAVSFRRRDQPVSVDGARNTNGWIFNSLSSQKANVLKGNLAANDSVTLAVTRPCFVSVGRASNTGTSTTAFIDGWGITYISNNTGAFTLSMTGDALTINNITSGYCSYMVVY